MAKQSKATRQDRIRKVMAGMSKFYGNQRTVRLAGTTYKPADLQKLLQADITSSDAADQAKAAWLKAVNAQMKTRGTTDPVLRAIRHLVLGDHGDSKEAVDVLAAFGWSPRKPQKASGDEMVAKANKARATRQARGTKGSRQKKEIKGSPAETVAVTATPEAPAAPTTPAASSTPKA